MAQPFFYNCAILLATTVAVMMFLELSEIAKISSRVSRSKQMPQKRTSQWIVLASSQARTETVKKLASLPDWTLVVVGNEKTPESDLSDLPGVHFLSAEIQASLDFASTHALPSSSQSRKNAGYLYAFANGAQWIYDTDDDHELYGKGVDHFDYSLERTRGLRFTTLEWPNATIQESLFNPYRHFGRPDIWPRGFPMEMVKNHDHHDGAYRLCRVQRPPVVQQGMVMKNPDVDSIYRLQPDIASDENFNEIAPPVILAPGTYAPFNSRNTLFSRSAFFGLFLPSSVPEGIADIWRSYFTQALLHLARESISFVPANAIKRGNTTSFTKGFDDEIKLFDEAGEIVQFIDEWECGLDMLDKCTIELTMQFASRGFWGEKDAKLIGHWVEDLKKIGYVFPALRPGARSEYPIGEDKDLRKNCRRAHVVFSTDLPMKKSEPAVERAEKKIENFGDLKVAIVTNNWQWTLGMGMLQRMYQANFAMLILCGHYPKQGKDAEKREYAEGMAEGDSNYPNLKRPFNYIHLSNEEVRWGYLMYYCLAKVVGDEDLECERWPNQQFGFNAMNRTIELIPRVRNTCKYKSDPEVAVFERELMREIGRLPRVNPYTKKNITDAYEYLMVGDGWTVADWMFVPAANILFVAVFAQLAHEGELFHELFASKMMHILPSEGTSGPVRVDFLWNEDRNRWARFYSEHKHALHPVKLSEFQKMPA